MKMYIQKNTATRYVVYNYVCVSVCAYISCEYCAWVNGWMWFCLISPLLLLSICRPLSSSSGLLTDIYLWLVTDGCILKNRACTCIQAYIHLRTAYRHSNIPRCENDHRGEQVACIHLACVCAWSKMSQIRAFTWDICARTPMHNTKAPNKTRLIRVI